MKRFKELFTESFEEYTSKFGIIFKIFLFLYFIPLMIFGVIFLLFIIISIPHISGNAVSDMASSFSGFSVLEDAVTGSFAIPIILFMVLFVLVFIVLMVLMSIAFVRISFSNKKEMNFSEIFGESKKFFWRYLGLCLTMAGALIALFILLIIPGIIFMVYWVFSFVILVGENSGIVDSMKKSKSAVKGSWWRVFGYFLLICLISVGVSIIAGFIPVVGELVQALVITPFWIIFLKNFYLDLKKSR